MRARGRPLLEALGAGILVLSKQHYVKTLAIKLPEDVDARLDATAKRTGRTKSALVREAVTLLLDSAAAAPGSAAELAGELVGSVRGLPADLSDNPAHLKGFGR